MTGEPDDMPLPGPPDDLDGDEREAWLDGAAAVTELLAQQGRIIANAYDDLLSQGRDDRDEDAGDGAAGHDCDAEPIDGLGGQICPECGDTI